MRWLRELNELFWQSAARFLAAHPAITLAIIGYAVDRPYAHIVKRDGSRYMDRWWIMPRILLTLDENGHPYPYAWVPVIPRIHWIRQADGDRDVHDHPADYRTILFYGWYVVEDVYGRRRKYVAGDTISARAEEFHTIVEVSPGGVWTMFIMAQKRNEWGFLVGGRKVGWREYAKLNPGS